jgi:hypothetical protein
MAGCCQPPKGVRGGRDYGEGEVCGADPPLPSLRPRGLLTSEDDERERWRWKGGGRQVLGFCSSCTEDERGAM